MQMRKTNREKGYCKRSEIYGNICQRFKFILCISYLVDFFVDLVIDLSNNELKYSSDTPAKRDSAAIGLVFKAGAFR